MSNEQMIAAVTLRHLSIRLAISGLQQSKIHCHDGHDRPSSTFSLRVSSLLARSAGLSLGVYLAAQRRRA